MKITLYRLNRTGYIYDSLSPPLSQYVRTMNKEAINLKVRKEGYVRGFRRRNEEGEFCNYIIISEKPLKRNSMKFLKSLKQIVHLTWDSNPLSVFLPDCNLEELSM